MSQPINELFQFEEFRLNARERKLERVDGQDLNGTLRDKAFEVLVYLIRNKGRLVTKEELLSAIWPDAVVEETNLSKAIHAIRQYLGETGAQRKYIETVPKHGYRFVADVLSLPVDHSDVKTMPDDYRPGDGATAPVDPQPVHASSGLRWQLIFGGLLAVSLSVVAGLVAGGAFSRFSQPPDQQPISSLAVIPFEDLSADKAHEYFSDGMTEALISDLTKIESLRVISRHAVMRYKTIRQPLPEIGSELQVEALITGSVSRADGRVRVSVQIVQPSTGQTLWAESYSWDETDVLRLQRRVAEDIAGAIRVKLSPQERTKFGTVGKVDPAAYDDYLRGKFYLHRQTRENNDIAIAALERAVAADPAFAPGRADLAQAYVWKLFLFEPENTALAERAFIEAEKALALDPNLAGAYLARGRLLWTPANRFPHDKAIREYKRSLEFDSNLDEARNQLALVYNHVGAFEKALAELELAIETNPSNSLAQFRIGETYLFQERYEDALSALREVPDEVNPALVGHQIVWALFNLERRDEAVAELEKYLQQFPDDNRGLFTSQQAVFAAAVGDESHALEMIKMAIHKGRGFGHFHHTGYHIACAYALMDKRKEALDWLETIAEEGFPCFPLFQKDKNLTNLRNEPRFEALIAKLRSRYERFAMEE